MQFSDIFFTLSMAVEATYGRYSTKLAYLLLVTRENKFILTHRVSSVFFPQLILASISTSLNSNRQECRLPDISAFECTKMCSFTFTNPPFEYC